jgi:uncharacterized protein
VPFFHAGAPGAARNLRSAPKGSFHRRFSETCPSAAISRFPKGLRAGHPFLQPAVRSLLFSGSGNPGTAFRLYRSPQAGNGSGPESPQAAVSGSCPLRAGSAESAVPHRHQSAAQSSECALAGTRPRSGSSSSSMQWLVIRALRAYKFAVSPLLPAACRYYPSCSDYMREAVERYGAARGVWMGLRRLARCHPFHAGGFDPVR